MSRAHPRAPRSRGAPALLQAALLAALAATALGTCGPPPSLPLAFPTTQVNTTSFMVGQTVKYSCRPGYVRTSSSMVASCQPSGEWVTTVDCTKKRCQNPGDLPNGHVVVKTDFTFGARLEFTCSEGLKQNLTPGEFKDGVAPGASRRYLSSLSLACAWGAWGALGGEGARGMPFGVLAVVKCEPPPAIAHGRHSGGNQIYTFGASVTYSCDPTFSMLGKASISCRVENRTLGVWRPSPPACKKINCPYPDIKDGKVAWGFRQNYMYQDSVSLACNEGYILRGSSLLRCDAHGTWDPPLPTCELNSCVGVPSIPHTSWLSSRPKLQSLHPVGTKLDYYCLRGYRPAAGGPTSVTCGEDLQWTPATPSEMPPAEATLPAPSKTYNYLSLSDQIKYTCDKGYVLVGSDTINCKNLHWTPEAPQCRAQCQKPRVLHSRLSLEQDLYPESQTLSVHCDPGYTVVGAQNITCSEYRTWVPAVPKCEWVFPEGCEQVEASQRLLQCLPNPQEVRMALEVYKLSLEIEQLEWQRNNWKESRVASEL
ncbi:PREDICTED: C4b-binding protein alpha chain [Condylura cristata]|uniref:C4b-binding protein alpha chain n=1 Tax=Condylura cristata TaxID=143302 RepID=UPI000642ABBF|nr:PREDICTED: C4b-binding protein alpha chain [Condylura cristata]